MRITGRTRLAGIMGWPVAHSRSPRAAQFLARRDTGSTAPTCRCRCGPSSSKQALRALAGARLPRLQPDDPAQADGAVDRRPGRAAGPPHRRGQHDHRRRRTAASKGATPMRYGFRENLRDSAAGLGSGGRPGGRARRRRRARAVVAALIEAGVAEIRLVNRTPSRAEARGRDLRRPGRAGSRSIRGTHAAKRWTDAGLLVNTTSLGMTGEPELDDRSCRDCRVMRVVVDIVYVPLETAAAGGGAAARPPRRRWARHAAASGAAGVRGVVRGAGAGDPRAARRGCDDAGGAAVIILGLTGSIGMGKSTAAAMLRAARRAALRRRCGGASAAGAGRCSGRQRSRRAFPGVRDDAGGIDRAASRPARVSATRRRCAGSRRSCIRWSRRGTAVCRAGPSARASRLLCSTFRCSSKPAASERCDYRAGRVGAGTPAARAGDAPAGHDREPLRRHPARPDAGSRKAPARRFCRADRARAQRDLAAAARRSSGCCGRGSCRGVIREARRRCARS